MKRLARCYFFGIPFIFQHLVDISAPKFSPAIISCHFLFDNCGFPPFAMCAMYSESPRFDMRAPRAAFCARSYHVLTSRAGEMLALRRTSALTGTRRHSQLTTSMGGLAVDRTYRRTPSKLLASLCDDASSLIACCAKVSRTLALCLSCR